MRKNIFTSLVGLILCTMTFLNYSCDEEGIDLGSGVGSYTIDDGSSISIETALLYKGHVSKTFTFSHEKISNFDTPPSSYISININTSDIGKEVTLGDSSIIFIYNDHSNDYYAQSGSLSITQTDDKYSINFDITLLDQRVIRGNYVGILGIMNNDPLNNDDDNSVTPPDNPNGSNDQYNPNNYPVDGVTVSTSQINIINGNTAIVNGSISITNANITILEQGFCYAPKTDSKLNYSNNKVRANLAEDSLNISHNITCTISGLGIKDWKYRAYAMIFKNNSIHYVYGEIQQFSITEGDSTITLNIGQIENLGSDYACCTATIGLPQNVTSPQTFLANANCGFCYCKSGNTPTIDSSKIDCTTKAFSSNNGTYSDTINNLTANSQYVVRAYLTNKGKTVYSEERYFTTLEGLPTDTVIISHTNTTSTSLTISVYAIVNSDSLPTAAGLCYSTTGTPTIGNSTLDCMELAADGDGVFTATIQNLTPGTTYHVRGYMTIKGKTIYSNKITKSTLDPKK